MTPLDYAVTYAVYVLSSAGAATLLMYGWSLVLRANRRT